MRTGGVLGWAIFAVAVVLVWNMRAEIDPEREALQRTVDMIRTEYPGAQVIQKSAIPAMDGTDATAAIVVFSEAGQGRERRVYADYIVQCDEPKPACMVRKQLIWDYQDPDFLARASAQAGAFY